MQLIPERLAVKIEKADIDQQSSERFRMKHMFDPDFYGEILPRRPGDGVYQFIDHPNALSTDDGGVTEKTTGRQIPDDHQFSSNMRDTRHKTQIKANDIHNVLGYFGDSVRYSHSTVSRNTATPGDVFAVLADNPVARRFGITPHQRISAAARAYRAKPLENGTREIDIGDIYRTFTMLSCEERELLAEAEIRIEMNVCFAFSPYVELIRLAHARGIKIIIVSDMYLREGELRRLLDRHLPPDAMQAISKIYCFVDYGTSKSHGLFRL
ncbi:hypothetical protein NKH75_28525 [Mesorhizobium sp. M0984]|uniref:hypothetical protein n=1 Tax=Mesorhizobium sp. M0984 TaxID=2957041 RepID=UPI00333CB597